jgi:hypothetical protein
MDPQGIPYGSVKFVSQAAVGIGPFEKEIWTLKRTWAEPSCVEQLIRAVDWWPDRSKETRQMTGDSSYCKIYESLSSVDRIQVAVYAIIMELDAHMLSQ